MNQPASVSPAKPAVTRIRRFVTIQSPDRFDSLAANGATLLTPEPSEVASVVDHLTWLQSGGTAPERMTLDDARAYIAKLNAENHLGHDDWRLPERAELVPQIADGKCDPATYDALAHDTQSSSWYWTNTPVPGDEGIFFVVDFDDGFVVLNHRSGRLWVRPVRSLSPSGQSSDLGAVMAKTTA